MKERKMIVVGVDGSAASDIALHWAFAEASLRDVPIRAIIAYLPPVVAHVGVMGGVGFAFPCGSSEDVQRLRSASEAEARRILNEALARLDTSSSNGGDVVVETIEGAPAETLIHAGENAELLVVGSRRRGRFTALLLGSVSQQCAQHAPCPVIILPPPSRDEPKAGVSAKSSLSRSVLRRRVSVTTARRSSHG